MTAAEVFQQIAGFLVQSLPIAILCFIPFSNQEMKLPKRIILPAICGGLVLLSIGFGWMCRTVYDPTGIHSVLLQTAANLYMFGSLVLGAIAFWMDVGTAAAKKFLVLVLLVHYAAILFTLNSVINGKFANLVSSAEPLIIYSLWDVLFYSLLLGLTCPFVGLFLNKVVRTGLPLMEHRSLRRGCAYLTTALLLYCLCIFIVTNFNYHTGITGSSLLTVLLALILTDAMVYYIFFAEVRLAAQNQQLTDQLRSFDQQYRQICNSIEESRRTRHDLRHHLNVISALNQEGKKEELTEYLQQYNAVYQELEMIPLCNYPALDNVLRYYFAQAKEEGISTKIDLCSLPENMAFDVTDITVLIGNLMENAIESCRKLSHKEKRFIHIWVRQNDVSLLIQIENSCPAAEREQPEFSDGTGFVSTKPSPHHGQGLKSVRYVAGKYGGSAEFKKEKGLFTSRVVLNFL